MNVEEYTREFERLLIKCDLKENEDQTLVRYLGGLDERIAHVVELHPYNTLDELSSLARKVELQKRAKGKNETHKPPNRNYPPESPTYSIPMPFTPSNPKPPLPIAPKTAPKPKETQRCFRCQGLGHIASECPNKRVITLAEFHAHLEEEKVVEKAEEKEVFSNESLEEIIEGPDEGELLMVRRALSGLATQDEQREAIFHSRCTVGSKVCSLIIDGGSCTNVVSKTMVDKLKLLASPHPTPYTIQWLEQGKGLNISSRCLISLSIGKNYKDEIWCDVIPMDACHILLGRPWLFDRSVTHDGRQNTYSLFLDHRKITLVPMRASQLLKSREAPQKDILLSSPLKVECHEFAHVSPQEVSHGLPPQRTIQRETDLVPGFTLPRKPAYQLNPHSEEDTEFPSLRTNFSQVGKDDGDHPHVLSLGKAVQTSSWGTQESKAKNGLIKAPWTVFDPGKGQP